MKTEEGTYLSIDALEGEPVEIPEDYMEVLDEAPEGFYDYGEADTLTLYILGGGIYRRGIPEAVCRGNGQRNR